MTQAPDNGVMLPQAPRGVCPAIRQGLPMTVLKQQLELHEADGSQFRPNQTMPWAQSKAPP